MSNEMDPLDRLEMLTTAKETGCRAACGEQAGMAQRDVVRIALRHSALSYDPGLRPRDQRRKRRAVVAAARAEAQEKYGFGLVGGFLFSWLISSLISSVFSWLMNRLFSSGSDDIAEAVRGVKAKYGSKT